jgi:UDP-N-acetylmuramoyl-L-alanyl-D-glutamate--2,6-diaminopimelate ligase
VLGALSALVYADPAADLRLLGVTGTQGKTTTTRLAEAALTASGTKAAVVGTVGTRIAGEDVPSALTTPEAPALHGLFAVMREQGVAACAMEVSSHALVMGRVDGVVFDVAAFTNLGRDHLDFHSDMDDYFEAKAQLFTPERARLGLVNVDDPYGRRLLERAAIPMRSFARQNEADWTATDVTATGTGSDFTLRGPDGDLRVHVPLPGDFNVSNAVCAVAGLVELGFDPEAVADGLRRSAGVPGRMEPVDEGQGFTAVVDYAHKPDAVEAVLRSLRSGCQGRLIIVIGAGGDRDRGKRPVMGEIAARLADVVVVTDDNPRSEVPAAIRAEVLTGTRAGTAEVHEEGDRRAAIRLAVSLAREGDCLVIAGKGHETGQEVAGHKHPFDDRDELRAALRAVAS